MTRQRPGYRRRVCVAGAGFEGKMMIDTAHEQRIEQWSRYYASIGATFAEKFHNKGRNKRIIGPRGMIYRSVREAAVTSKISESAMRRKLSDPKSGWKFEQEQPC